MANLIKVAQQSDTFCFPGVAIRVTINFNAKVSNINSNHFFFLIKHYKSTAK